LRPNQVIADGFTFVEAIVVGVIVAVLSAVAIPLYSGYLKKSKQDRVRSLAATATAAANAHLRRTGTHPAAEDLNLYFSGPDRFDVQVDDAQREITVTDTVMDPHFSVTSSY
jgi:Tfp pilus assembly protein PilE